MPAWDVIVVGAGIEGSATAYTLAKLGFKTLQLEQFTLPHNRGSSHGHSQIIRKAYAEPHFAEMMPECYSLWEELGKETNNQLYVPTGLLTIDKTGSAELEHMQTALRKLKSSFESFQGKEISKRFPTFKFDDTYSAIFDSTGGILRADKCLESYQSRFKSLGGTIRDGESVVSIEPVHRQGTDLVNVKTQSATYQSRSVVIAAGPWTSRLINPLGLSPPLNSAWMCGIGNNWRRSTFYTVPKGFPTFIYIDNGKEIFGLPELEYPGLAKVAFHGGNPIDPDRRDSASANDPKYLEYTSKFVEDHMPGLETQPSITEKCIYTWTPDEGFILDRHPKWKNVIIGAGFSGHGFKLAPVVGKVLAELATGRTPSYDLKPFRLDRFETNKSKL